MSVPTLNHQSLKALAVEEFSTLRKAGLIQFSFDDLRNHVKPCLYGQILPDICCANAIEALRTIHYACHTVVGNSIENNGIALPRSIVSRFIENYGSIIVMKVNKESLLIDTTTRQDFFLTPLETFIRFPNNEVGRHNEQFLSQLFF